MIRSYRRYLEPEFGNVAPEVCIGTPQIMDFEHPTQWRTKTNFETIAAIVSAMSQCVCYEPMMSVRIKDTYVERDGANIPLRIYYPDGEGPHPVMVFYHGGAFMMNGIDVYDLVHRYFTRFGNMIVVAVEYRLAPEYPFPTGIEDAYAGLVWAAEHMPELGGDRDKLIVCGDSSGGNFATVTAMMARDRKGPKIWKQVLIYPLTIIKPDKRSESELRYGTGYFLEYNSQEDPVGPYFTNEEDKDSPYASPLCADSLKGMPQAAFFSAECDPLLDQGLQYAARLEDEGVKVEYQIYKGMIHAFLNSAYGKTFDMMNDICSYINRSEHGDGE